MMGCLSDDYGINKAVFPRKTSLLLQANCVSQFDKPLAYSFHSFSTVEQDLINEENEVVQAYIPLAALISTYSLGSITF